MKIVNKKASLWGGMVWVALFFSLSTTCAQAQSLVGRTYYNANIMSEKLNDALNEAMPEARADAIAKEEKEKGRKLTDAEKAEIDKKIEESLKKADIVMKGMKTAITVEFKSEKQAVMTMDLQIDEDALKKAGVGWAKRKAMKAVLALAPTTEKSEYILKGNLVIMDPKDEPDTLRLSDDGKYLYGKFDKKTDFKLTRTK